MLLLSDKLCTIQGTDKLLHGPVDFAGTIGMHLYALEKTIFFDYYKWSSLGVRDKQAEA